MALLQKLERCVRLPALHKELFDVPATCGTMILQLMCLGLETNEMARRDA